MIFTSKRTLWTSSLAAAGILCMLGASGCGAGSAAESPESGGGADESSSEADGAPAKAAGTDNKDSGDSTDSTGSPGPGGSGESADAEESGEPQSGSSSSTCTKDDLTAALGSGHAAAGTHYRPLMFTNVSGSPCVMHGFPGVSYVTGDAGTQVGAAAAREGGKTAAVTLASGEVASATVGFANVENFDATVCEPTSTRGLRVYPPGETDALFVAASGTGCAGTGIPGDQLTVKSVQAGAGA